MTPMVVGFDKGWEECHPFLLSTVIEVSLNSSSYGPNSPLYTRCLHFGLKSTLSREEDGQYIPVGTTNLGGVIVDVQSSKESLDAM